MLQPGEGGYRVLALSFAVLLVAHPLIKEVVPWPWLFPFLMAITILASIWALRPQIFCCFS